MNFKKHIDSDPVCRLVAEYCAASSVTVFLIGGYVRDLILKRQSTDIDFVVDGNGIELAQYLVNKLHPSPRLAVFKTFQTAHFRFHEIEYEFVGARRESYNQLSRNPLVEPATIEEDRLRRDFTINTLSIGLNPENFGLLIDPFDGLGDIKHRMIKTPLNPFETFNDDPLRMLRAVRFSAQLDFSIDAPATDAMKSLCGRIHIVAPERIAEELNKIILSPKPSIPFLLLQQTGLLNEILPEIAALAGVDRVGKYAHKDILLHTLEVLDNVAATSDNLWLRWAALLHDVGKPVSKRFIQGTGWTFHGHEVVGGRMTEKIFKRLKMPLNDRMDYVKKIVELHLRPIALVEEEVTDSAVRRLLFDAGDDVDDLMLLCRADITSKNESKVKRYLENFDLVTNKLVEVEEKDRLRNWQPPVSGDVIMETFGLKPSREVGMIKTAIREAILDGHIPNEFNAAYSFMISFARGMMLTPKNE
jgi:poly(A) polymerase